MAKKRKDKEKDKSAKPEKGKAEALATRVDEIKRLNRIVGQIEGIKKMLEGGRELNDILAQCKAVHSALRAIESRVLGIYVAKAIDEISSSGEKKKSRDQKIAELIDLYRLV
jgi:DNA-binding FrmR family transcriptional regulator